MAVALDGLAAGFADDMFKRGGGLFLWRCGAGHVEDFLFHDRAVQVVDAVAERDLRERQTHADPVGGEMIDVVEVNAADREIAKLLDR